MDLTKQRILRNFADDIATEVALTPALFTAFSSIDREYFIPEGFRRWAYKLDALPMASCQWISSPVTVAKMTMLLQSEGADSVLEIGCGSGYQAAILSQLFRRVFTIERIEPLLKEARERFKKLDFYNIHTRLDDGQKGWREYAPFDRILLSAAIDEVPETLFNQLASGGILVAPIAEEGKQTITRYSKKNSGIVSEKIEQCAFVPVCRGIQK